MDGFVSYTAKAQAISGSDWDGYLKAVGGLFDQMPAKNRIIAGLLWSIERFGDLDHMSDPAPLHMDMADRIIATPGAVDALVAVLQT